MDDHQSLSRQVRAAFGPGLSLYEILGVPRDASAEAIRRAYRLRALKLHPDKGGDEEQFKALAVVHAILSDETKRRNYDASGDMDTHDLSEEAEHWYNYFRSLFPRVTVESIDKFRQEYRLSEEERRDVVESHGTFLGDFAAVMENVMLAEDEDTQRLADIIEAAIDSGEVVDYVDKFRSTSKVVLKNAQKELKKKLGRSNAEVREDETSRLRELQLMMQRNAHSRERALDGLLARYGTEEARGASNSSGGQKSKARRGQSLPPSDIPDEEFEAIQRQIMKKSDYSTSKKQKK